MNLNKKELVISVILVLAFLFIGVNANVLATSGNSIADYLNTWNTNTNINNDTNSNTISLNLITNTNNVVSTNNSINNMNSNTPGQVPDTGLEDAPWLIIGICIISAAFAYKKIKEYKID